MSSGIKKAIELEERQFPNGRPVKTKVKQGNKVHLEIEVLVGDNKFYGVACARRHFQGLTTSKQAKEITCKQCSWVALTVSGHQHPDLQEEYKKRILNNIGEEEMSDIYDPR